MIKKGGECDCGFEARSHFRRASFGTPPKTPMFPDAEGFAKRCRRRNCSGRCAEDTYPDRRPQAELGQVGPVVSADSYAPITRAVTAQIGRSEPSYKSVPLCNCVAAEIQIAVPYLQEEVMRKFTVLVAILAAVAGGTAIVTLAAVTAPAAHAEPGGN